ncbi:MAG TPA: OmpA family protein, partial [Rhodocyclaceae bacterium]|nr:OmpA family protein [Rhodocyclaceae bacterium]
MSIPSIKSVMQFRFSDLLSAGGAGRGKRKTPAIPPSRKKLLFEALEPRLLLAADLPGADTVANVLTQRAEDDASAVLASQGLDRSVPRIIGLHRSAANTLVATHANNRWEITGVDEVKLNGELYTGISWLVGGDDNQDTFVFTPEGYLSGGLHGGLGGFDTLVIEGGDYAESRFDASGRDSGTVVLDGKAIQYAGLEPIVDNSNTTNRVFTGTAGADQIKLRAAAGGQLAIESLTSTFETVIFAIPSASLTIDAGGGDDVIEVDPLGTGVLPAITLTGGTGTDRVQITRKADLVLSDAALSGGGENYVLNSIEQAVVNAPALDSAGFTGTLVYAQGAPEWVAEGPGPITGAQVAGMAAQNKPVAGAINAVLTSRDGTILAGTVNGGVWRNGDRTVFFEFDTVTLTAETQAVLQRYAEFLRRNPTLNVTINGHTDDVGDAGYNLTLSQDRAQAVADYLAGLGISASRFTVAGLGETQPTAGNGNDEGRALNRRVELITSHWEALTDQLPSLSISALARDLSDPDVIYAGTGRVSSFRSYGEAVGLFRSSDGGDTWEQIGRAAFNDKSVYGIVADGDDILVVSDAGVHRSDDGGDSFVRLSNRPLAVDGVDNDGDGDIDEQRLASATIQAAGSGYAVGDSIQLVGGTFSFTARGEVTAIGAGGAVTGIRVTGRGEYTALPANPVATSVSTGAGSGLTLDVVFEQAETVLPIGAARDIVVDPADASRVYAAINGEGVYFSDDFGLTWQALDNGFDAAGSVRIKLAISGAEDPVTHQRPVFAAVVGVPLAFLTADAAVGDTVIRVDNVIGFGPGDRDIDLSGEKVRIASVNAAAGTITLAAPLQNAHPTGDVLEATSKERILRMYRLAGAASAWTQLAALPGDADGGIHPGGQGEKHFSMLASQTDPDVVYVGGDRQARPGATWPNLVGAGDFTGRLFRGEVTSAAGAISWTPITDSGASGSGPHADSRAMVFAANGDIIEVDDGGIYRLADPENSAAVPGPRVWTALHGNLQLTEVTSLAYDNVNDLAIVGAQDNGVSRQSAPGDETWNALQLADGGVVQVANIGGVTGVQYSSFQSFGNFGAHTNTGAAIDPRDLGVNGTGASKTHLTVFDKVQFANPYVVNAIDPTKFLVGSGNFNTGSGHLYLTAPDGVGNNDPMDDLALQNGAPVLNAGAFAPSATAQVGATMALAYGGRERDGGGNLVDQVEVAYAATLGNTAGSGKLYVRMAAGANFVEITGWNTGAPGGSGILDIALNPENWRRFYVIDGNSRVWRGELAADGSTNCTFTQITGNLTDLIQVGGRSTELGAIELYFDNAGTNATGDDTEVVLVGGWGGVFRAINPGATGAWSEFGVGLPNVLVTDLQYDKTDDILLAGTLGRGLFTVRGADAWLATDSVLTIRGRDGAGDAISLERNAAEPWLVDITLGNAGAPANGLPPVQQQLSAFRTIDIAGQGGNDTIVLDSGNGPIEVANRIEVRGGAGTDTLEMPGIEAISVGSADGGAELTVQGLDSFLDTRTERVHVAGVENAPDLGALPIDPVDAALGGLEAFSESLRHLIEEALRGQDIPLFDAGSLAAALNGITFDQSDPLGFAVFSQISQVEAGGLAQLDDGGSVLRRLFGFNIADWVGQVTTAAELRDKLDALDDIAGNVALNETGGVTSFDLELFSTLSGIASLEVDGPATVGARLLDGGTVELGGEVELQFDVKLDLSFGVDADGFFITTGGAPVLTVNRLRANALDLQGQGRFGFLGVELSDASLSIDPLFNYTFSLAEPAGGAADGKARLTELDDPAAAIPLSFASAGPGTADIVLEAALGVAPILPGLGALFSLPLTDATLTWADADTPSFDIGLAGAAGDALKTFTALDPEALLAQFVQFRDTLNNLVNSLPVDIPLVSQGLSGLVDLLDLVDDKLLSQLRTILPSGPSSIPSFETLQEFTSGLVSSLTDQAAGYLLDLADLGDFFSYDATANELLFTFEFGRDFVANDNLDLGFDLEEGLADLDFSTPASIDTGFEFATTIGLDLDQIFAGADPLDWFFLRDTSVSADIALAASDIDASARFGFLSIGIVDGSASGHAALSLSLNDPESNAADGRIDLGELLDGLSNLGELVDVNLTGSVEVSLPISVPFLGINPGPNTTMLLNWADVSDPASIDLQLPADLLQLPNFTNMDAGSLLSLLGQI